MSEVNWNEATLEQCRDRIAESQGWKKRNGHWYHPIYHRLGSGQKRHPIPATLDAIAGALPEGWKWCEVCFFYDDGTIQAHARDLRRVDFVEDWTIGEADTELLARSRCVCLALEAEKGTKE